MTEPTAHGLAPITPLKLEASPYLPHKNQFDEMIEDLNRERYDLHIVCITNIMVHGKLG